MKGFVRYTVLMLLTASVLPWACTRKQADIPDVAEIITNIRYLDSLVQSEGIDSIERINDGLSASLVQYANRAQTPDDKSILDSLGRLHAAVNEFLRFCEETPANLEIMEQEVRTARSQYLSGKMNVAAYISNLLQYEQVLVDIHLRFTDEMALARRYTGTGTLLVKQLIPLPIDE